METPKWTPEYAERIKAQEAREYDAVYGPAAKAREAARLAKLAGRKMCTSCGHGPSRTDSRGRGYDCGCASE